VSFPPVWNSTSRNFLELANRWGTPRGANITALLSGVLPVTVVERFRDNLEGSLFGVTAETAGNPGEFSAVIFTSLTRDWQVHSVNVSWPILSGQATLASNYIEGLHVFNPIQPYNPVLNSPVGFFVPGLINNAEFTFGTVVGIAGTNPAPPVLIGMTLCDQLVRTTSNFTNQTLRGDAGFYTYESVTGLQKQLTGSAEGIKLRGNDRRCQNSIHFIDPPLRVRQNGTICFQLKHAIAAEPFFMQVSMTYTEIESSFR